MVHWYQNNTYPKARKAGRLVLSSAKKPRSICGIDVFEQRYKIDVNKKAEDVCKMEGISLQSSVNIYKRALQDMYQDADPDVTVAQKTAPMFAHFGKIGMVRSSDISKKSGIII